MWSEGVGAYGIWSGSDLGNNDFGNLIAEKKRTYQLPTVAAEQRRAL